MKKIMAVIFLALLTLIAIPAFIPDEEYTPGAQQWLDEANTIVELPVAQNSFNALVGFNLREGEDTITAGAAMVTEVNKQTKHYRAGGKKKSVVDPRWNEGELKLTEEWRSLASKVLEGNPVEWLRKNPDKYKEYLVDNQVLLSRYRQITTMKQYSNYIIHNINAPFIPFYGGLLSTNKLNNLSIIYDYTNGRQKNAINRLSDSIRFSRLMLRESRLLINKMVAVALLNKNLHTYAILQDSAAFKPEYRMHIKNLDKQERTMRRVFKGEFALMSTAFNASNMGSLFADDMNAQEIDTSILEEIYLKFYLKHRKIENKAYKNVWLPYLARESMTLAKRKEQNVAEYYDASWWDYYVDPVGTILFSIAMPSYYGYIDGVDSADAYISLLKMKDEIKIKNMKVDEIEKFIASVDMNANPGYSDAAVSLNKNSGTLTFVMPGYSDKDIPSLKVLK